MPRFFLHIRDGNWLVEDLDGSDLPDLDAARLGGEAQRRLGLLVVLLLRRDVVVKVCCCLLLLTAGRGQ